MSELQAFMNIIRMLNGGSIIKNINDSDSRIELPTQEVELFCEPCAVGQKYYYFFSVDHLPSGSENDLSGLICSQVEEPVIDKRQEWSGNLEISASDSYLILFLLVEDSANVETGIIRLEENEYYFKKYIFYYTQAELNDYYKWAKDKDVNDMDRLMALLDADQLTAPYAKFITRFMIKVPCICPRFQPKELGDYVTEVEKAISAKRNFKNELLSFFYTFEREYEQALSNDKLVEKIVSEIEEAYKPDEDNCGE